MFEVKENEARQGVFSLLDSLDLKMIFYSLSTTAFSHRC